MKTPNEPAPTENINTPEEINIIIEPVAVLQTTLPLAEHEVNVPEGYVLLTALNPDGTDIPGSDFFYPETKYKRFFGDETKFRIKKN
jgi:hypothetical protein